MSLLQPDLYAVWRSESPGLLRLRDGPRLDTPAEHVLQQIWQHQRLRRDALRTLDGRPVLVLHPGFRNREAGPDFRNAVVQIGDESAGSVDVEVDLSVDGWRHHHHDTNPAYRRVGLHVVWEPRGGRLPALPTLALSGVLDAPLADLESWLATDAATFRLTELGAGACAAPFGTLEPAHIEELLLQAARVRLHRKADSFQARARDAGWEQALWEGLFAALGYKHNSWPMRRLGELRSRITAGALRTPGSALLLQARLLGVSGLLPADLPRARGTSQSRGRLKQLWDIWWRERAAFAEVLLPPDLWRLGGVRPANHPQRRLALVSHWLSDPDWLDRLEAWMVESPPDRALAPSLQHRVLAVPDDYWSHHWTLRSPTMATPRPLLGPRRCTDLAVNVLLPWFWSRALAGSHDALRRRIEQRYFAWPASEDNAVLRLARQRLFGNARIGPPRRAALQQGLLQLVRDFCDHTDARCGGCGLPQLVQGLGTTSHVAEADPSRQRRLP